MTDIFHLIPNAVLVCVCVQFCKTGDVGLDAFNDLAYVGPFTGLVVPLETVYILEIETGRSCCGCLVHGVSEVLLVGAGVVGSSCCCIHVVITEFQFVVILKDVLYHSNFLPGLTSGWGLGSSSVSMF